MRSIWKGSISFGLVSIGVKLYTATEERDVSFHQVRRTDGSRIRYKRVAEVDGEEVQYADIAKGFQLPSGDTVVLTDDDFADLPLPTARVVDVLQFVPLDQIDPIYFAKSYYLEPEKTAVKPYLLLRDALDSSGQAGLVKVAIRNREQLATLRVRDGVIVMETMIWPDEVREPAFGFLDSEIDLRPQERQMAESLVSSMSGDFDPSEYTDDYRAALQEVIDAKIEGREIVETEEPQPNAGNVVDLMSALKASVEAAKKGRAAAASTTSSGKATARVTDSKPVKKAATKKAATKKTATKKTATKKTATKKTATKKTATKAAAKTPARKAATKAPAKRAAAKKGAAKQGAAKKVAKKTARKSA
jgi:DNA end-binding protein Ku